MNFPPNLNLSTTPLLRPPPGVESNFEHPQASRGDGYRPIIICFTVLGAVFVLIRLYTRIWITRRLGADDCSAAPVFLCLFIRGAFLLTIPADVSGLSMIFSVAWTIPTYMLVRDFKLYHAWDYRLVDVIPKSEQLSLAVFLLFAPANTCVKSAIFLLYLRIFKFARAMRITAWGVIIAIVGFYFAAFFATLFACNPWKKSIYPLIPGKCIDKYVIGVISAGLNIIIDVIACLLPIQEVLKLQITRWQKIQLIAVFAVGIFACIVSVLRLIAFLHIARTRDKAWYGYDSAIWTVIELNVAIVCSCAPAVKPFFQRPIALASSILSRSGGREGSSGTKKSAPGSSGAGAGSGGGRTVPYRRPSGYRDIEAHELSAPRSVVTYIGTGTR